MDIESINTAASYQSDKYAVESVGIRTHIAKLFSSLV